MNPTLSVVLPTFNRAETYLPQAVRSVMNQTLRDWELIIVDDCSTDGTPAIVKDQLRNGSWISHKDRIRYVRLEENSGTDAHPRNVGIMHAQGEYIAYLDDDCEWLPPHLANLFTVLASNRSLDLVYSDIWIAFDDQPLAAGQRADVLDFDPDELMQRNFVDPSAVLQRRTSVFEVGGFDERLPLFVDWNLWVRMLRAGAGFQRVPSMTCITHKHPDRLSLRVEDDRIGHWFDPQRGRWMVKPTFDPLRCELRLPYLTARPADRRPRGRPGRAVPRGDQQPSGE